MLVLYVLCIMYCIWCMVYCVWIVACPFTEHEQDTAVYTVCCLCMMVYGVCVFVCHLYCTTMVVYCMTILIRRIVHDCIYWLILWLQYQSILYVSTRNKIFWSVGIAFRRSLLVIFCGKCHISNFVCLRTPLGDMANTTFNASFFGTFADSSSFPTHKNTLLSLLVSLKMCWFECRLLCWRVVFNMVIFDWVFDVLPLGRPVLLSTYCTHCAVKLWEYHSTLEATVQHYDVPVLSSTYCTHDAVKYWEYHSTLEATVQH
jgi:hypothetical protein